MDSGADGGGWRDRCGERGDWSSGWWVAVFAVASAVTLGVAVVLGELLVGPGPSQLEVGVF